MNPLLLGPVIEIVKQVIDRVVPDREGREKAKQDFELELLKRRQEIIAATQASDAGQVEINKVEAAAPDLFRGGWRPFVGWVCGFAVAYQFLGRPLLTWLSPLLIGIADIPPPPPLDMADLIFLLGGMLGLGTLRTVEKKSGVA
jgi:hypothetical protein